jgi:hypothetical protein
VRRLFEVNSEPHTGARPSVSLCVGPELSRCVHMCLTSRICEQVGCWRNRVFFGHFKKISIFQNRNFNASVCVPPAELLRRGWRGRSDLVLAHALEFRACLRLESMMDAHVRAQRLVAIDGSSHRPHEKPRLRVKRVQRPLCRD